MSSKVESPDGIFSSSSRSILSLRDGMPVLDLFLLFGEHFGPMVKSFSSGKHKGAEHNPTRGLIWSPEIKFNKISLSRSYTVEWFR